MNKERLNNIIKGNLQLTEDDLEEIKSLTEEFPFCQIGHILSAVAHKQHEHMLSEDKIITAAVHTGNRKKLRSLINSNSITPQVEDNPTNEKAPIPQQETIEPTTPLPLETTSENINPTEEKATPPTITSNIERNDIGSELEKTLKELQNRKTSDVFDKIVKEKESLTEPFIPTPTTEEKTEETEEITVFTSNKEEKTTEKETIEVKTTKKEENNTISSSRMGDELNQKSTNSSGSFTDIMLEYLETLEEQRSNKPSKEDQLSIIDNFIEKDPNISRAKPNAKKTPTNDLAKESVKPKIGFVSENLAKINAKQGNISKAIDIYDQLILKFPEKKSYFAEQIDKLK